MSGPGFLGLPTQPAHEARFAILPLPFEGTVSYGKGTARGPAAILEASAQVELWDEELEWSLETLPFHTAEPVEPENNETPEAYLERVRARAEELAAEGPLVLGLGGEHSLTPPLVEGACRANNVDPTGLTVVQIDAHADLREEYEGRRCSHACAMRRVLDLGVSVVAIGIRSVDQAEAEFARTCEALWTFPAQRLAQDADYEMELLHTLHRIEGPVYLTIDIDGLDPSLCPATGTPQPGGLGWWPTLRYLHRLLMGHEKIQLIGADLVETVPMGGTVLNEFTAARLACKIMAYATNATRRNA